MTTEFVLVKVNGEERAKNQLRLMGRKIKNPIGANKKVSVWLLRWVNENFRSEGGKVGGWKPFALGGRLMPDGSIDRSAKLLQDTGRLRGSFNRINTQREAGVGAWAPYAVYHQLGAPKIRLPARPMLPLISSPAVESAIIRIYDVHIMGSA